ncbi:MAG: hypothetical protein H6782_01400 [Candidatus Nomurabacteria bacterium]|nr:MAG: hypothetical protein H6782_01400 [Candidatus Nomurabacteria bacterium]
MSEKIPNQAESIESIGSGYDREAVREEARPQMEKMLSEMVVDEVALRESYVLGLDEDLDVETKRGIKALLLAKKINFQGIVEGDDKGIALVLNDELNKIRETMSVKKYERLSRIYTAINMQEAT